MNREQYVKKILRHVIAADEIKERIRLDLLTGIENREESGLSMEEIISRMGSPREVAEEFNRNYPECVFQKKKRRTGRLTMAFALLTALCLAVGGIGRSIWLGGSSVARIGGADRPTGIRVVSEPFSALSVYEGLLRVVPVLFLLTVFFAVYFFLKYRRKDR
jgi:hypothetical protein